MPLTVSHRDQFFSLPFSVAFKKEAFLAIISLRSEKKRDGICFVNHYINGRFF